MNLDNPLLIGQGLPPFDKIKTEHIEPAIQILIKEAYQSLDLLEKKAQPSWNELVEPLNKFQEKLSWAWGIVGHLMSVKNSPELRKVYEKLQPEIVEFYNKLSQSEALYKNFKALKASSAYSGFESVQKRIVEAELKDFELSGIGLEKAQREKFNQIQLELAELANKFSNNVLDATKAFGLILKTSEETAGLPQTLLNLAAQNDGTWKITLDAPFYIPFMQYSQNASLREKIYKAYIKRASEGELNNKQILKRILELRQEEAELLSFANYAELSLQTKMAPSLESIYQKLEELRQVSYKAASQELKTLKDFAKTDLKHWDITFWAERLKEANFNFSEEDLRPYFSFPQVLNSLFNLTKRLFKINIQPAEAPVWHEDVQFFEVSNEDDGQAIAYFYLDPYTRPAEKRGGAWMNDCIGRAKTSEGIRLPVAYLICNQTPPIGDKPSLMSFMEVTTLFHEFGHGLQHMLTKIDYPEAAGINNIEWDAVELPSQFMENWCYEEKTLKNMAKHYLSGENLPDELYQKLLASKNFMSGSAILRQLHFSLLDLELHKGNIQDPEAVRKAIGKKTLLIEPLPEDAFLCSFSRIFAGGYSAGYYSYKWAEILSSDAFAAFEEVGLENEQAICKTGELFRDTVLALGGSKHPLEIFQMFRQREPKTEALLRHNGLVD